MKDSPPVHESMVVRPWPDCGKLLGISKPTVYSWLRQGLIPSVRVGTRWLIPRKALEAWLDSAAKRGNGGDNGC